MCCKSVQLTVKLTFIALEISVFFHSIFVVLDALAHSSAGCLLACLPALSDLMAGPEGHRYEPTCLIGHLSQVWIRGEINGTAFQSEV